MVKTVLIRFDDVGDFVGFAEEHVFHSGLVVNRGCLGEVTEAYPLPDADFATVRLNLASEDLQQSGLANPVVANKAKLFTLGDPQRDILK